MSHERMLKVEAQLEAKIQALLRRAELIDAQGDACYGKDKGGDEVQEELQRRASRLERMRKARKRQQEARSAEPEVADADVHADAQP